MRGRLLRLSPVVERLLPWLVLGLLLLFTYALFFVAPYAGFWYRSDGHVDRLFVTPAPEADLRVNDQLIQIGPVLWTDFVRNFRLTLFDGLKPGDKVPLVVERDGRRFTTHWVFSGASATEILHRLASGWFLAYFFWLAGTTVLLAMRPKDVRWHLLIAFYYLTALWLVAGSGPSATHTWESANVLQAAVWLSVPVYWHLHWVLPQPLRPAPRRLGRVVYGLAGALAIAAWFALIPPRSYVYGLLLAVGGAAVLLFLHFFLRPAQRRDIGLLVVLMLLAIAPLVVGGFIRVTGPALPYYQVGGALLTFPLLPAGYVYAAYRRRLANLELRRNRLFSTYLFIVVLSTAIVVAYALLSTWLSFSSDTLLISLVVSLLAALVVFFSRAPFQRFVERRLLGVPPAPTHLLTTYASRIATRLDMPGLLALLKDEILPGLLVRQSALFHFDDARRMTPLYRAGVDDGDLPTDRDVPTLLTEAGTYRPLLQSKDGQRPRTSAWVRLALPLRLGDQTVGLWLLGRRDPDDEYAPSEITVLQSLADQTAIALAHLVQSELLRAAYKADVDRMETERTSLARELHDHALNDLARLKECMEQPSASPGFQEIYTRVTANLRQTITGLRPAMLNYGLCAALNSLADALADRAQPDLTIELDVPQTGVRYAADLEQHLYRVVQQACENALRHAQAHQLTIHGRLAPDHIDLSVEDDGVGFAAEERLDLAELIARRHFGLAGMYERATLIRAKLLLDSFPGRGTRIRITWAAPADR